MSRQRKEAIGFFIVAILAVLFIDESFDLLSSITDTMPASIRVFRQNISAALLNVSTELIGAIAIYIVFRVIIGDNASEQQNAKPIIEAQVEAPQQKQPKDDEWKEPLVVAITTLVQTYNLEPSSIQIFRRPLQDGIELLSTKEIRELRVKIFGSP